MKGKIYNDLQAGSYRNTPEKNLWLAVLEQMLVDYNQAIVRKEWNLVKSLIRQMEYDHMRWICDTCEIHPDRIVDFMYKKLSNHKNKPLDLRFKQQSF